MLEINDIHSSQELDQAEASEIKGGMLPMMGMPFAGIIQMTSLTNMVGQNAVSLNFGVAQQGQMLIGGDISISPVNAASAVNLISSPALPV